ncbi:hydroxyacid dehydrogenase [Paraburkholderia sediminicola]|uniref:Hydroxyacid dehydrogenase n=1 Tax=Paraburkholderia metrosideri TaxID=580937 RepID=A0ABW9E317_9BURK
MKNVFVSHPRHLLQQYYGDKAIVALQSVASVTFNCECRELTIKELSAAACDSDIIVAYRQTPAPESLFSALPKLSAFVRCAVDIRTIDVDSASRHGVLVTHASAGFIPAVSEWVLGCMIDMARNISTYAESYRRGEPPASVMGRELRGATAGIIGYGQISRYLCDLLVALGMRVLIADPHAYIEHPSRQQVPLTELLGNADFVICLAALNTETENLLDRKAFASMKQGAWFINAARGELADEVALLDALDSGRLAGCALDVGLAPDQMPSPIVARHPRVIATPHVGGLTSAGIEHQALETVEQVKAILLGQIPIGAVNATHATRMNTFRQQIAHRTTTTAI